MSGEEGEGDVEIWECVELSFKAGLRIWLRTSNTVGVDDIGVVVGPRGHIVPYLVCILVSGFLIIQS